MGLSEPETEIWTLPEPAPLSIPAPEEAPAMPAEAPEREKVPA